MDVSPISKLEYSANEDDADEVYVDLGSIPNLDIDVSTEMDLSRIHDESNDEEGVSINTTIEEWRSNNWIVLIDDKPATRLVIGDYLHSIGYSVINACDGPMAFLEVLLWLCS